MNSYEARQQQFDWKLKLIQKAVAGKIDGSIFSGSVWLNPDQCRSFARGEISIQSQRKHRTLLS